MLVHTVTLPNGYAISDDVARLDMDFVHQSLLTAYWAKDRPRAVTDRSWRHSLSFGLYAPDGAQAGFARLITDFTLRAHLADVFVDPARRGLGLGRALVETILGHPELATVRSWTLTTKDAQGLYAQCGFVPGTADPKWMTLSRRPDADAA